MYTLRKFIRKMFALSFLVTTHFLPFVNTLSVKDINQIKFFASQIFISILIILSMLNHEIFFYCNSNMQIKINNSNQIFHNQIKEFNSNKYKYSGHQIII